MPKLPSLTGTAFYQIPTSKRVDLRPVFIEGGAENQLATTTTGKVWVERDKLHVSPPAPRDAAFNPNGMPVAILNESVSYNRDKITQGLRELRLMRRNFAAQLAVTTSVTGFVTGTIGAAGTGAMKGLAVGPKGAIIGAGVGVVLNVVEVGRRRWNNGTTEKTLKYIDEVIKLYENVYGGDLTRSEILAGMLDLKIKAEAEGPAARAALAELELRFEDSTRPFFQELMVEYQVACSRKMLLENRS